MAEAKAFYLTTPIYYVNDAPHIGHAYASTAGDVATRWHRQRGEDVWFLTGVDEHGTKVERAAAAGGVTPQEWVDRLVADSWLPVLEHHQRGQRRLHPHDGAPAQGARPAVLGGRARQRLRLLLDVRGSVLRRLRGVQAPRRPGRRRGRVRGPAGLPGARPPRGAAAGGELVLPPQRVPGPADRPLRGEPGRHPAAQRLQRGAVVHPAGPRRHLDVAVERQAGASR